MTDIEWKYICRKTKEINNYKKFKVLVKIYIKTYKNINSSVEEFKIKNSYFAVKNWLYSQGIRWND